MNVFSQMATSLSGPTTVSFCSVSIDDYNQWKQEYLFDALMSQRYGQSFCNRFNITDNILFYERDAAWADKYIKQNYLLDGAC